MHGNACRLSLPIEELRLTMERFKSEDDASMRLECDRHQLNLVKSARP